MNIPKIKHSIPKIGIFALLCSKAGLMSNPFSKAHFSIPIVGIFAKKLPLLLVILPLLVVGCTTTKTYVAYDGPCPLRPELEPIPVEMQIERAPYVVRIVADNQLKLKQHIKLLEVVSGCTPR